MWLIRCRDVGECPALSAGPSSSIPSLHVLHFFGSSFARRALALQQQEYGRFFVEPSIDMTCINAQFAVQHCPVASAFEHAACMCDTPLVIWHPMLGLRTTPLRPEVST